MSGKDPERWAQIEELYHAALERQETERDAFLREACGDDDALRQEVLSMLDFDAHEDFLQKSPMEIAARIAAVEAAPLTNPKPGQIISHYKIIEKLGEGGMGVVYKAEDVKLARTVALKFLAPHATTDPGSIERFLREAKASAALDHPNVCTLYEIGEAEGRIFLAMALVDGERVSDKIARRPLKLAEALDIAIQTAQGLHAAHEKGIVHRDIKSANLMINRQGQVKIMDFGIAKLADQTRLTHSMMIVGTTGYLSPEQAQRQAVDHRSDIWSLGIVLYEIVTGRLPFEGDQPDAVLHSIIHVTHEPVTALRVGLPTELDRILSKALAKSPDERYQHADEFLTDLRALAKQSQPMPGRASNITAADSRLLLAQNAARERKLKLALGVVALLFAVSLSSLAVLLLRKSTAVDNPPVRRFSMPFEEVRPVISPDGRRIAYRSDGRLWVRDLNAETPREIPAGKAAGPYYSAPGYYLTWSPDSKEIIFPSEDELRRVSVEGGAASVVCKLPRTIRPGSRVIGGVAWSKDGETIVFSSYASGIYEVPARGGSPKFLWKEDHADDPFLLDTAKGRAVVFASGLLSDAGIGHALVVRMPDGERRRIATLDASWPELVYSPTGHILFRKRPPNSASIWALPFSSDKLQAQGEAFMVERSGQGMSLSEDGTLAYIDMGRNPQFLVWRDRTGNLVSRASETHQLIDVFFMSPDRSRAVVTAEDDGRALWIYDVETFVKRRLSLGSSTEGRELHGGFWPRYGNQIYYSVQRTTNEGSDVFEKSADDLAEARPVPLPDGLPDTFKLPGDGTADGRYQIWLQGTPGQNIWLSRRDEPGGKSIAVRFSPEKQPEGGPALSPNERYFAFTSGISGRSEVYVRPFPEGPGRWQVSTRGGTAPVWGPDSSELFYAERNMLMRVRVSTTGAFSAGAPEPLFQHGGLAFQAGIPRYAISPDGKKFLMVESERETTQPVLRIVENWTSEFRHATQAGKPPSH